MTREVTIQYLQTELDKLFPNNWKNIRVRKILGEWISVTIIGVTDPKTECANGIIENDPLFMSFMFSEEKDGSWSVAKPLTHRHNVLETIGCKRFVTIKGTEQECAEKLVKWFTKYSDKIRKE